MKQNHKPEIEEITGGLECPQDFLCYKEHYENFAEAKSLEENKLFAECFKKGRVVCNFLFSFENTYYCTCFFAVYIAKKLKK
jgi:hypothetical protein